MTLKIWFPWNTPEIVSGINVDFNSWLKVKTINVIPRSTPEIVSGFSVIRLMGLMVETRPTLLEEHRCASHLVQDDPDLRWIIGKPDLFQPNSTVPSATRSLKLSPLFCVGTSISLSLRAWIYDAPKFSSSSRSVTKMSSFTMPSIRHIPQWRCLVLCRNRMILIGPLN